ncbi:hypothetical protein B0H10DRAFT_2067032 [Mycena sp. CBHHK59/15]|nr:hypothetical protein B0H10DRAFT_2067032 [Mycena sp. CBHHK59/15]
MKVLHEFSSKLSHHDHVDNLEYTFYMLYTVCCGYDSHGNPLQVLPSRLAGWSNPDSTADTLSQLESNFPAFPGSPPPHHTVHWA